MKTKEKSKIRILRYLKLFLKKLTSDLHRPQLALELN